MNYKNYSLGKLGDKLVKAMEAKEHFDKKSQDSIYINKIQKLKEVLTEEYKFATLNKNLHMQYITKASVIEKHINYIKKIQNNKTFDTSDKQIIDQLLSKYGINS